MKAKSGHARNLLWQEINADVFLFGFLIHNYECCEIHQEELRRMCACLTFSLLSLLIPEPILCSEQNTREEFLE